MVVSKRIGLGAGDLHCEIIKASLSNLRSGCNVFVKVLYVEPGQTNNVLFRSKECIYQTKANTSHVYNAQFHYKVLPPSSTKYNATHYKSLQDDWNRLTGDLLFVLYCREQELNMFLGQTLLPLRSLVDGFGDSISSGIQNTRHESYILKTRDGEDSGFGMLELMLRLSVPEDKEHEEDVSVREVTSGQRARKSRSKKKVMSARERHLREANKRRERTSKRYIVDSIQDKTI